MHLVSVDLDHLQHPIKKRFMCVINLTLGNRIDKIRNNGFNDLIIDMCNTW